MTRRWRRTAIALVAVVLIADWWARTREAIGDALVAAAVRACRRLWPGCTVPR